MASSAQGLKEDLEEIARKRALTISKVVVQIYAYAVKNPDSFPSQLEAPRPKPGKHISTEVTDHVAEELNSWARDLGRSRTHHCCFILECVVSSTSLQAAIFKK